MQHPWYSQQFIQLISAFKWGLKLFTCTSGTTNKYIWGFKLRWPSIYLVNSTFFAMIKFFSLVSPVLVVLCRFYILHIKSPLGILAESPKGITGYRGVVSVGAVGAAATTVSGKVAFLPQFLLNQISYKHRFSLKSEICTHRHSFGILTTPLGYRDSPISFINNLVLLYTE